MRVVTNRLRLESRGFHLSYLNIKLDDEIIRQSLRISSIISDYPASKVKLTSRSCYIYSQSLLLDTSVTYRKVHRRRKAQTTLYGTPIISSCSLDVADGFNSPNLGSKKQICRLVIANNIGLLSEKTKKSLLQSFFM